MDCIIIECTSGAPAPAQKMSAQEEATLRATQSAAAKGEALIREREVARAADLATVREHPALPPELRAALARLLAAGL